MENIKWNSGLYDTKHAYVSSFGEDLLKLLAPQKGEKILDLGCGTGHLASKLAENGVMVKGIDSSADMILAARQNFPQIAFEVKDATNFYADVLFDAIFSNAVLHWVTAKEKAIECMFHNLKPGGRLVVEFGGKGNIELMLLAFKESMFRLFNRPENSINIPWYFPSIGEYCSLLEIQGFHVKYAIHFDRPTELASGDGIKDWFRMFGGKLLEGLSASDIEDVLEETQDALKITLLEKGKWYADYKRLRIFAVKP